MSLRKSPTLSSIRDRFAANGWTYGTAAKVLQVDKGHLHRVLNGERSSERLISRISSLPKRKKQ